MVLNSVEDPFRELSRTAGNGALAAALLARAGSGLCELCSKSSF